MQLVIILILVSCFSKKHLQKSYSDKRKNSLMDMNLYRVYKIDSIRNFYLIYAEKNDVLYKIVSEKTHVVNCQPIRVTENYPFVLHSHIANRKVGNMRIMPGSVDCFYYGDSTFICLEESIYDLHSAENVSGLCFLKDYKRGGTK